MTKIADVFPEFARMAGPWIGVYCEQSMAGVILDQYTVRHDYIVPGRRGSDATFDITMTWPDGRSQHIDCDAQLVVEKGAPAIVWNHEVASGRHYPLGDGRVGVRFRVGWVPGAEIHETIQVMESGLYRIRVWDWIRDGIPFQRTLVTERRPEAPLPNGWLEL
jgi:hypothetical protein